MYILLKEIVTSQTINLTAISTLDKSINFFYRLSNIAMKLANWWLFQMLHIFYNILKNVTSYIKLKKKKDQV